MNWIKDLISPTTRSWEEFYRNRWQHDRIVRSTHGVNCTGGCSWNIYVKQGIVTWEMQALDYPLLEDGLPPYEPRGCQRGISYSWYLYSPIRVKYPYVRGALVDLWREARKTHADPVAAWESIVNNAEARATYQRARGKGGFRRASWEEMLELISASLIHTIKKHGSDRIVGFSPIPAMSFLSYGAGSRFLQLLGGVNLSFYDWYSDLPPASPEIWDEQTDVCEGADWYNSKFIAVMGSNPNMTRTPDCHFLAESRHNGTKVVVLAPDFSQVSKYSDQWIPLHAGQDGAFWMGVNHVILKEFHVEQLPSTVYRLLCLGGCLWTFAYKLRWSFIWTSALAVIRARLPARTSGRIARARNICGGTTSRPSRARAIRPRGKTSRNITAAGNRKTVSRI